MSYRLFYEDATPVSVKRWRNQAGSRSETFATEHDALKRARQLLDDGEHQAVVLCDSSGNSVGGIRLQLRLGMFAE